MDSFEHLRGGEGYPAVLSRRLGEAAPARLHALGASRLPGGRRVALLCSVKCPGGAIIRTFDAVRALRDAGVVVVGGFHSPMERECLDILLRGRQPVILCLARGLAAPRLGGGSKAALADGRLLVLSPFGAEVRRTTAAQAARRNQMVAALSDEVLAPHASPGGKTWRCVGAALERGQTVWTFDIPANAPLMEEGAQPFPWADFVPADA